MKGGKKSRESQLQSQAQQNQKHQALSRLNNRIKNINSNISSNVSQSEQNYSEINQSVVNSYRDVQQLIQSGVNDNLAGHNINPLEISEISRISPQSSTKGLSHVLNQSNQSNTQQKQQSSNNQFSSNSLISVQKILANSKIENINSTAVLSSINIQDFKAQNQDQKIQQGRNQQIDNYYQPLQISQPVLSQTSVILEEQSPSTQNNQKTIRPQDKQISQASNNKRLSYQPVTLPLQAKSTYYATNKDKIQKAITTQPQKQTQNKIQLNSTQTTGRQLIQPRKTIDQPFTQRCSPKSELSQYNKEGFASYVKTTNELQVNNSSQFQDNATSKNYSNQSIEQSTARKGKPAQNVSKNKIPPTINQDNKSIQLSNNYYITNKSEPTTQKILGNSNSQQSIKISRNNQNQVINLIDNQKSLTQESLGSSQTPRILEELKNATKFDNLQRINEELPKTHSKQYKSVIVKSDINRNQSLTEEDLTLNYENDEYDKFTNQSNLLSDSNKSSLQNTMKSEQSKKFKVVTFNYNNFQEQSKTLNQPQNQQFKKANSKNQNQSEIQQQENNESPDFKQNIAQRDTPQLTQQQKQKSIQNQNDQTKKSKTQNQNSKSQQQKSVKNQTNQPALKSQNSIFGPRKQINTSSDFISTNNDQISQSDQLMTTTSIVEPIKNSSPIKSNKPEENIINDLNKIEVKISKEQNVKQNQQIPTQKLMKVQLVTINSNKQNINLDQVKLDKQKLEDNQTLKPIVVDISQQPFSDQTTSISKNDNNEKSQQTRQNNQKNQNEPQQAKIVLGGVIKPRFSKNDSIDQNKELLNQNTSENKQQKVNSKGTNISPLISQTYQIKINEPQKQVQNQSEQKQITDSSAKSRNGQQQNLSGNQSDTSIMTFLNLEKQAIDSFVSQDPKTEKNTQKSKTPLIKVINNESTAKTLTLSPPSKQKIDNRSKSRSRADSNLQGIFQNLTITNVKQINQSPSKITDKNENLGFDQNFKQTPPVFVPSTQNNQKLFTQAQTSLQNHLFPANKTFQKLTALSAKVSPIMNKVESQTSSATEAIGLFVPDRQQNTNFQSFLSQQQQNAPQILLKPPLQQLQNQSKLSVIANQQQKINNAADMIEYMKLQNELKPFFQNNSSLQSFNLDDSKFNQNQTIQYEEFRLMLKHLNILNDSKVNPVQDYLIGQMWVKELQATDKCPIKNSITLLTAILGISRKDLIIQNQEALEYQPGMMSVMHFSKQGEAKFKNQEDVDNCAKTYQMLSKQREGALEEIKIQKQNEKNNKLKQQPKNIPTNFKIAISPIDKDKSKQNSHQKLKNKLSPRSNDGSDNSLEFSDLDRHTYKSRVVVLSSKKSDDVKLDLSFNNNSGSQQSKQSPNITNLKNENDQYNSQFSFRKSKTIGKSSFASGNDSNKGSNTRMDSKSKFTVVTNQDYFLGAPQRRHGGQTPRIQIGQLDDSTQKSNDQLYKSVNKGDSSDNIRASMCFPTNLIKNNKGKVQFATAAPGSVKGKKKIVLELQSPDQFLNQIEQLKINPKFDAKSRMPVDEDSDKSKFGNLSDYQKLDDMIGQVGAKFSDQSEQNKRPLLFMDVNLGKTKGVQKLIVYENDSPKYVAKKFGDLHELKKKARNQLAELIEQKIEDALEARRNIRPRSRSPEIRSREPSPTDQTLRVVKKTQGVKVKSNTHGEVVIQRVEEDEEVW